jgi:hypothetical protein
MVEQQYNLIEKTDAELHNWMIEQKPGTDEYVAGIRESMRRVAAMEELMEKTEEPVRKREMVAIIVAMVAIAAAIAAIVLTN